MINEKLIAEKFLDLPRPAKIFIAAVADAVICILTVILAYYLRVGNFPVLSASIILTILLAISISICVFFFAGLYKILFRYNGRSDLFDTIKAVLIYGLIFSSFIVLIGINGIPRTIGVIQPTFFLLLIVLSRFSIAVWLGGYYQSVFYPAKKQRVLIYGAGVAGRQLARALVGSVETQVVGFLDDDRRLQGKKLNGLFVHEPSELSTLSKTLNIKDILLAMPVISRKRRNEILSQIQKAGVSVRTLPSVSDLAQGKVVVSDIRELDIDDLLGREAVTPNLTLLARNITNKIVMVTGAGGSIGSELCRQIIGLAPEKILLVEQSEFALYEIHQELISKKIDIPLVPLLASVQDDDRINEILSTWHPHIVYHAAAYKHVPLVEHNLSEGLKNNVLGTLVTAHASITHKTENFVLISTDKAVRPTNIMGASKRLAEMVLQALAAENSSTTFSMVRFGNVLGSSGSVVPKFRQQIKEGGPVTITHPEITRFFMTISEASQLVIQAGAMAKGGDVFVLDMGEPVKIIDLAERMIELSGLSVKNERKPNGDIEIEITQLRPGEKLYEELLIGNNPEPTAHRRIVKAHETFLKWDKLEDEIKTLITALNANDVSLVRHLLETLVTDYQANNDIVDWVYLEQEQKGDMH